MANLKSLSVASLGAVFMALETTCAVQAQQIFYGNPQPVGDGFVRSYVTLDDVSGTPLDIGVDFSPEVLSSPDFVAELVLPPEASATAFKHLELTYDSRGLPGNPEVFNVPRYRVDFFLIDRQERDLICPNPDTTGPIPTCVGGELAQALKTPEPGTVAEGLLPNGTAEASYGTRYFDPDIAFPIVSGQQPFNSAYDYGFFGGKPTLIAVGASKSFVETQPNVTTPIKIPTSYPRSGYYPTAYSITYDTPSQEYRISLSGLTFRSSTPTSVPELSPTLGLLALGAWGAFSQMRSKLKSQKLASK